MVLINTEILKLIIVGILVIGIAIYIFKTTVRVAVIFLIIVYLFRFGWVYQSSDLRGQDLWNKILGEEAVEFFYEKYDAFSKKRDANSVIDAEKVEEGIRQEIIDKTNHYLKERDK